MVSTSDFVPPGPGFESRWMTVWCFIAQRLSLSLHRFDMS